ncbi:MAG: hypothetical protein OEZ13_13610 [Spirochaetia bacterium]|nr:hypothetical protein [Spirochaetia bacterium]
MKKINSIIFAKTGRRIICFLLIFFCAAHLSAQEEDKKRIAVMPFEYGRGVTKEDAQYVTEKIRTELIKLDIFEVISNDQIEQMMQAKTLKQSMGQGSCSSESCIIDLGNALECEKMLVGSASEAFGEFAINAKILDVVLQKYEGAEEYKVEKKEQFPDGSRQLVILLVKKHFKDNLDAIDFDVLTPRTYGGMLWRTAVAPGWGHLYAYQNRGWLYLGFWGASGAAFLWSHTNYTSAENEYVSVPQGEPQSVYDDKFAVYEKAVNLRKYMSLAFAAAYLFAVGDILLTGDSYSGYQRQGADGFNFQIQPFIYNHRFTNQINTDTGFQFSIKRGLK